MVAYTETQLTPPADSAPDKWVSDEPKVAAYLDLNRSTQGGERIIRGRIMACPDSDGNILGYEDDFTFEHSIEAYEDSLED